VADKKTVIKVRQPFALVVGQTYATTLGNQTHTHVSDPKTNQEFTVTLIWEKQGKNAIAAPYIVQVTAGKLNPMNSADIERKLGISDPFRNYPISSTFMRRIPFERIIDASRQTLIQNNSFFKDNDIPIIHELDSKALQAPKKQGRPFDRPDSFYIDIAKYYDEAKSQGGSYARKPATYIQNFLEDEIGHLADESKYVQIRKWVAEARKRGHLPKFDRN
jgi:hypothetical protein